MAREANWEERSYWKLGPNFGIDVRNPQLGLDGANVYTMYGVTDDLDNNVLGLTNGSGLFHIYNDRSIEIIAGQNNSGGGVDIVIAGKNGDVTITAERNGNIRIRGKNIIIDADENINLIAGRNVNIKAARVVTQSNQADCIAKTGNLAPKGTSTGEKIFPSDSKCGVDLVETAFSAGDTNKYGAIG
jgi:hypothetical protein